jgi:FkbM family methyltransferase
MNLSKTKEAYKEGLFEKHQYIREMHRVHQILFEYAELMKGTDLKSIEITDGKVIVTTRREGLKLTANPTDKRIPPFEILNFDSVEYPDYDMVLNLTKDGMTIFDIGANVGWYSLTLGKQYPFAHIYAFEPVWKTFNDLLRHIALNKLTNITTFNFGFSDKEGTVEFYYYPEDSGNASLTNVSGYANVETIWSPVWKLDRFVHENNTHPDFIKCDVEGAELMVFKGGLKTLERDKPIIFTELLRIWSAKFGYHPNDVITLLKDIGYQCFSAKEGLLYEVFTITEKTKDKTFFFLHNEKHWEIIKTYYGGNNE